MREGAGLWVVWVQGSEACILRMHGRLAWRWPRVGPKAAIQLQLASLAQGLLH